MTYKTQHGEVPTHVWPGRETMDRLREEGKNYALFFLEEGQSIPQPGSTKHLWRGPGVYIAPTDPMGSLFHEFDVPPMKWGDERCGWMSTPNLGVKFDLGPYEDGRTFVDLVEVVEAEVNA